MKSPGVTSLFKRAVFILGLAVLISQASVFVVLGEQSLSESFESADYEEFEEEETLSWLPESMLLVWDINYSMYAHRQDHLLNPEEAFFSFDNQKGVTSLDLEWNPVLSDSLTLRTREVVEYVSTDSKSELNAYLLEGYLQWINGSRDLIVDLGKIKLEWGSGYAWKPTQVIFRDDSNLDTDKESDEGLEMIQVEFVIKNTTNTLLFAALEDEDGTQESHPWQAAYRISLESEPWEISLLYHKTSEAVTTTGLSFTGLLSDAFEIHGEWAKTDNRDRQTIVKAGDGIQMGPVYLPARYAYEADVSDRDFDKVLLGAQYTFPNDMNVIVELFRTTHGYSETEWQRVITGIDEALIEKAWENAAFASSQGNPYAGFLQQTMGLNEITSLRQNYLFLRWTSGETENLWEWEQIFQLNLDDESQMSIAKIHKALSNSIKTELSCYFFRGGPSSEHGLNPYTEFCSLAMAMGF